MIDRSWRSSVGVWPMLFVFVVFSSNWLLLCDRRIFMCFSLIYTNLRRMFFHALWHYITFPNAVGLRLTKWLASVLLVDVHCAHCDTVAFRYPLVRLISSAGLRRKDFHVYFLKWLNSYVRLLHYDLIVFEYFCFAVNATVLVFMKCEWMMFMLRWFEKFYCLTRVLGFECDMEC